MKKKFTATFALLILAGTAGAQCMSHISSSDNFYGRHDSSWTDKAPHSPERQALGWKWPGIAFGGYDLAGMPSTICGDDRIPVHAVAETGTSPVNTEELGGAKGGAGGFGPSVPFSMIISAITLWDEVKTKRHPMQNQLDSQMIINQNIRR